MVGALIATGLSALSGLTSGRGAQHCKSIGSNLDDTDKIKDYLPENLQKGIQL